MSDTRSLALLVDVPTLQTWEFRAVSHLLRNTQSKIDTIIVNIGGEETDIDILNTVSLWKLYAAHRRIRWILAGSPGYRKPKPIPQWDSATKLRVEPKQAERFGQELPARAVAELEHNDVAVRFGFGVLKGEALTAPTHGVLGFHHGDLQEYRGRPAGFWELINGETEVGITVQRLSKTLDGGEIAAFDTIDISDTQSWPEVLRCLFKSSEPLLTEAVKNLDAPDKLETPAQLGPLYTEPDWRSTLRYCAFHLPFLSTN